MFTARCALRGVSRQIARRPAAAAAVRMHSALLAKPRFGAQALAASSRRHTLPSRRSLSSQFEDELEDDDYDDDDELLAVRVGELAPEFECDGVMNGEVQQYSLADFSNQWLVLFFYPLNFTFVCPTEIIEFSEKSDQFKEIGCSVVGASVDSAFSHIAWSKMSQKEGGLGGNLKIPLLADTGLQLSKAYDALNVEGTHTVRATYIIDPNGVVRHLSMNDPPVGRNVDELLRLVKGYQFADEHGEVCPANWQPGSDTIKPDPKASLEYFSKVGKN